MSKYCANSSESNLQVRTVHHAREPLVNAADWKQQEQTRYWREELQNAKQNHFLAASSSKELEVTIKFFLYSNSSYNKLTCNCKVISTTNGSGRKQHFYRSLSVKNFNISHKIFRICQCISVKVALKNFCSFNRCRLFSKCIASTFLPSRHHDMYSSARSSWWKQPSHRTSYYSLNLLYAISSSTLTKIQKYTLWILKELYTMILRHRLIGCLVCNSKEKTLFKFDRYWDERPLGWKHIKRQQCFRLRIVWAQFMTKALHNKIYISIWCNVMFWTL